MGPLGIEFTVDTIILCLRLFCVCVSSGALLSTSLTPLYRWSVLGGGLRPPPFLFKRGIQGSLSYRDGPKSENQRVFTLSYLKTTKVGGPNTIKQCRWDPLFMTLVILMVPWLYQLYPLRHQPS